jgi:3-oxoacyl-[acyl-carrier-protein] synthase-3
VKTPGVYIDGLGSHLPESMDAREAVAAGLYDPEDHEWYGWTGAAVAGDMPAPDMAVRAARQAVERSRHTPSDLAVHFHTSFFDQGPEGWSAQHYVLRHVTDRDIPSFYVWQACNGLVGSLELAASLLLAAPGRDAALLTGADNVGTPGYNRWNFGIQNGVLGDAASALVLSRRGGFARLLAVTSASTAEVEEQYRGAEPLFPPSLTVGRRMDMKQRFSAFRGMEETVAQVVQRQGELRTHLALKAVAEADLDIGDITRVTHVFTGQESYLKVILDPLGLGPEHGLLRFGRNLGHCTVNDQVIGLEHLVASREITPGDHVLMIAHGGGVSLSCAVLRYEEVPFWAGPAQ